MKHYESNPFWLLTKVYIEKAIKSWSARTAMIYMHSLEAFWTTVSTSESRKIMQHLLLVHSCFYRAFVESLKLLWWSAKTRMLMACIIVPSGWFKSGIVFICFFCRQRWKLSKQGVLKLSRCIQWVRSLLLW